MNGDSQGILSFWQTQPDGQPRAHPRAPTSPEEPGVFSFWQGLPTDGESRTHPANGDSVGETKESKGLIDDFMQLTQKWCCAVKSQPQFVYTTDARPELQEEAGNHEYPLGNGYHTPRKVSPRYQPSPVPATFKGARNRAALMEGRESGENAAPSLHQETPPNLLAPFTSSWTGLNLSQTGSPENDDSRSPEVRDLMIPTGSQRAIPKIGEGKLEASPGSAFRPLTTRIDEEADPLPSLRAPPGGATEKPAQRTVESPVAKAGNDHTFKEWVNDSADDASSPEPAAAPLRRAISDHPGPGPGLASVRLAGTIEEEKKFPWTNAEDGASKSTPWSEANRGKVIQMNTHRDLRPLSSGLIDPAVKSLPPKLSKRRNTIAASQSYVEVHRDEQHHHHHTMQQHGKTGSRAPDHDEPVDKFVRHKICLTLLAEGGGDGGKEGDRSPSPVRVSPVHHHLGHGSTRSSLGGKPAKKKRASYEWAKAFVSHRKISDADYRICDDLVQGKGSEVRSAVLRALAGVRVLPRMDQVHVDTKTAGEVTVFISASQDVGTLIPTPDDLAADLMAQAQQPGSRLCNHLAGHIITSATRIPVKKPASPYRGLMPSADPDVGRPKSADAATGSPASASKRLSRMFSRRT